MKLETPRTLAASVQHATTDIERRLRNGEYNVIRRSWE